MKVATIGTGYVGLVTGACLADMGNEVICVDILPEKVDLINQGKSPIYEEGLQGILKRSAGKNLKATTDLNTAIENSEISFICVGTPSDGDGRIDLQYIKSAAESLGKVLASVDNHTVVVKSTVVPGTTENVVLPILEKNSGKKAGEFGVCMNPEFLREGVAVEDFMKPDRVVIGQYDENSGKKLAELYKGFHCPILRTDLKTAEMIKYASNSFLATKVSFINEIGNICKRLGIDTYTVAEGMSLDHRISPNFLKAGLGWGGSCFPKDIKGLISHAKELGYEPKLLQSALKVNRKQPEILLEMARKKAGSFEGKRVAVLGLAFKAETDDTRESQSFPVIKQLLDEKAKVIAYDPKAEENTKAEFPDIKYAPSAEEALRDADIALILTDWEEFQNLNYSGMKNKIVIDGRNIVKNRDGIDYTGLFW